MPERILINFPTNIGDVILSLPALDRIRANYPQAKITAIASSKTKDFLLRNNLIDEVILFDKSWKLKVKRDFAFSLRKKFDLVVDFKNSFLPVILKAKLRTPFLRFFPKNMHIKDKYLGLIKDLAKKGENIKSEFFLTDEEKDKWKSYNIPPSLFIACSSRSLVKRYPYEYLKEVVKSLKEKIPLVILGESSDYDFYKDILSLKGVINLVGKTSISDVFYLLKNYSRLFLGVDSGLLHIASYLNIPTVALFGPTDPCKFGPYAEVSLVLRKGNLECSPCQKASCRFNYECMKIEPKKVLKEIEKIFKKRFITEVP